MIFTLEALMGLFCCHSQWAALFLLPLVFTHALASPLVDSAQSSFVLETRQFQLDPVPLEALTAELSKRDSISIRNTFNVTGTLVQVDTENANQLTEDDIAFVSCDDSAYHGHLGAHDTIKTVVSHSPTAAAVLLYSTEHSPCEYSPDWGMVTYWKVFAVADSASARDVRDALKQSDSSDGQTSSIVGNSSSRGPTESANLEAPNGGFGPQGGAQGSGSPSSSVAMIVLYTVTGVIAALFLGVIITGAIRAHLHPERYGPRNVVGRPRQSRARGIARAMLETLPIVKFGDLDEVQNESQKPDIEMASHDGEHDDELRQEQTHAATASQSDGLGAFSANQAMSSPSLGNDGTREDEATRQVGTVSGQRDPGDPEHIGPARSPRPGTPSAEDAATRTLGCTICGDDFVKGEDVRLLPCNHKFHPKCVDHWLVDVSGTCPLCRIDLHPPSSDRSSQAESHGHDSQSEVVPEPTTEEPPESSTAPRSRRLTGYLQDIRNSRAGRASETPAATNTGAGEAETNNATTENSSRQRRLTERLRERFRVRTGPHGGDEAT